MPTKKFKYQNYLDGFKNCPPNYYFEIEMNVFRWVFEKCDEESFKPVLILKPSRKMATDELNCSGYALSIFTDRTKAILKYNKISELRPEFKKSVGTYIAEIKIDYSDGICSLPDEKNFTHCDFHEYKDTTLSEKVINIVEIFV